MPNTDMRLSPGAYRRYNEALRKKLVYSFGRGLGVGAELVGLVKAMMLCIQSKTQLSLMKVRRPRGFAVKKGYCDYFAPLFPETDLGVLSGLNRPGFFAQSKLPLLGWLARLPLTVLHPRTNLMFSGQGALPSRIECRELYLEHDYHEVCKALLELVWRPTSEVARVIASTIEQHRPTRPYLALHIRRGDKIAEAPLIPVSHFAEVVQQHAGDARDIFVASDDPGVPREVKNSLGADWMVWSVEKKAGPAYDQRYFNQKPHLVRFRETAEFMGEVEILRDAVHFFGSETSNVPILVRMMRASRGCTRVETY